MGLLLFLRYRNDGYRKRSLFVINYRNYPCCTKITICAFICTRIYSLKPFFKDYVVKSAISTSFLFCSMIFFVVAVGSDSFESVVISFLICIGALFLGRDAIPDFNGGKGGSVIARSN